MSAPPTFGLYRKATPTLADAVGATLDLELRVPVEADGVTLFRSALWLPLPEACRTADALSLESSTLKVEFRPVEFSLQTDDRNWFSRAEDSDRLRTRLELVWPASILRIDPARPGRRDPFGLHRADGEAVSEEATQRGRSGDTLDPPWVGTPVVVVFDSPVPQIEQMTVSQNVRGLPARRGTRAGGAAISGILVEDKVVTQVGILEDIVAMQRGSELVPGVRIAARPASPRLRLMLEGGGEDGGDRLLWQALEPGEHLQAVSLPGDALAKEWAAALEQALTFCQRTPLAEPLPRLRLDIESDGPCLVRLSQVAIKLQADHALLDAPLRLDFDGRQHARQSIALPPAPAGTRQQLLLKGRLRAATTPPADELPAGSGADGRSGLLLEEDQRVSGERPLDAPATLAGFRFDWHPLSERLAGVLRVLPANARRGTPPLIEQAFEFDTALPADSVSRPQRLAVRWPALDLQAQALRVELALHEGRGVWLASAGGHGWRLHRESGDLEGRAIGLDPQGEWLQVPPAEAASAPAAAHEPTFSLGAEPLPYSRREQDRFEVLVTPPVLTAWPAQGLTVASGVATEVVVESATLRTTVA